MLRSLVGSEMCIRDSTNAAAGIHIAQQDSTPMILFVGQIGKEMYGRDAFQEVDYQQFFGGMAKLVFEVQQADRLPEIVSRAYHTAMSGRPGPVIIALPENMLTESTNNKPVGYINSSSSAPVSYTHLTLPTNREV